MRAASIFLSMRLPRCGGPSHPFIARRAEGKEALRSQ
jgi:hypothetical protein